MRGVILAALISDGCGNAGRRPAGAEAERRLHSRRQPGVRRPRLLWRWRAAGRADAAPRRIGPRGVAADAVSGRAGLHAVASRADDRAVFDPQRPVADHLPGSPNTLPAEAYTMGQLFKDAGYATAIFGKWHLGIDPQSLPTAHGFDEFYGIPPDISWDSATYVSTIELTHSIPAPPAELSGEGTADRRGDGRRATAAGEALYAGGARRDRQRTGRQVDRLHEAGKRSREALLPLSAVLRGTRTQLSLGRVQGKVTDRQLRRQADGGRPSRRADSRHAQGARRRG